MRSKTVVFSLVAFALAVSIGWFLFSRSSPAPSIAPTYLAPKTIDPELQPLVNRTLKPSERIALDMPSRFPAIKHPEDIPILVSVVKDSTDNDTVRNEVVSLLRRSKYPGVAQTLIDVADNTQDNPRFRAFAIQHLGEVNVQGDPELRDKSLTRLRKALTDEHVEIRREALLALVRKKDQAAIDTAISWLTDPSKSADATRDLAINCVYDLDRREHIPAIRQYVRDPNEVIRIAAMVALSQWGDEESRTAFQEAAQASSVRLQRAGKAAVERLDKAKQAAAPVKEPGK